ncbi:MAG: ABC transporter permease [Cyclobacteriaceae bacterium]
MSTSFDLEKSIQQWREKLHKFQGIEPADIEELEDHLRSNIEELVVKGHSEKSAFDSIIERDWKNAKSVSKEYYSVKTRKNTLPIALLNNFLKVSIRSLRKRWSYSIINLFGLVLGLSSVFGISIYVVHELSYDHFHENGKEIYRVVNVFTRASGELRYPSAPPALAPAIGTSLPGIERVTRLRVTDDILLEYQGKQFFETAGFYADSSFLNMFSFSLNQGTSTALDLPNSIVLTSAMAKKYFGEENPIGKLLTFDSDRSLKVTGILEEVPKSSHIHFDYLISFTTYVVPEGYLADLNSWSWLGFPTYFQINSNSNIEDLETALVAAYKELNASSANRDIEIVLQPLYDIYLKSGNLSNPHGGVFATNNINTILSLVAIASLILFVASFNYLNITTASFQTRFKEMGLRQVIGSGKSKIIGQLITESFLTVSIAGTIALVLAYIGLQFGFDEIGTENLVRFNTIAAAILIIIALSLVLGLIIGLVAGTALIQTKMLELLKGSKSVKSSKGLLKHSMLFIQYLISAGLVMLSIVVGNQINYMNEKELGFEKEGVIVLSGLNEQITNSYDRLREKMKLNPAILSASLSSHAFEGQSSSGPMRRVEWSADQSFHSGYYQVGYEFLEVSGVQLIDGRFFSRDIATDSTNAVVLNETAAKAIGIESTNGEKVIFAGGVERTVIGIMEDFHFRSLHHDIGPLAFIMPFANPGYIVVKYRSNNLPSVIAQIESDWGELNQGAASSLTVSFLDDMIRKQYEKDYYFSNLIRFFTFLAILIACMGLWGLTSIAINLKIKQISIRKVLGAKPADIVLGIGRIFLLAAFAGTIASWPIVHILSTNWLSNFAYHINPGMIIFLQSLAIISVISGITLWSQFFRINRTNPTITLQSDR